MVLKKSTFGILVAVTILTVSLSYPVYREIRTWRATAMAKQAESMLNSPESMSRAWELAHAANALDPANVSIARGLARVYTAILPEAAYEHWQRVVELSGSNSEDQLKLAKAYLNAKRWKEFEEVISSLRRDKLHPKELAYLETLAEVLKGNDDTAFKMASQLVAQDDAPEEADSLFFQMTQRSEDPAIRQAGINNLWKIAELDGPRREEALQTLARQRELKADDINRMIGTMTQYPANSRKMRLLIEELRLRLDETDHKSSYERASELFQLDKPSEMAELGRWLNRHGLYQFTPDAIPLETAVSRQDLFLIYIDAMALDNNWEEIHTVLSRPRLPLEKYLHSFFKARTFTEMSDERRAHLAWNQALIAADPDSTKLYYLALKARQLNMSEFEILALQRVIETPAMRERAIKELIAILQRQGNTSELHAVMRQYVRYFPGEPSSENDVLYLSFLTKQAPQNSLNEAEKLLHSDPKILAYRMTLVLGLLRHDRADDAVKLLDGLPVNWFEIRDRWRLLAALALFRSGFQVDARKLCAQMDSSNLLPEERVFLQEINSEK